MITTTRVFDTYSEAVAAFDKAREAYEIGYGFYPKYHTDSLSPHANLHLDRGKWAFTYQRGESCD
jgi:hypothetical protein